jgi:hypothetical protein
MRDFLNKEAERYRNISENDAQELRSAFKNACQVARSMLGTNAFKRFYRGTTENACGYWEPKKFNASLYDVLMYTFGKEDKNTLYQHLDSIREALIYLMTENSEFIDAIELSTSSIQAVTKRCDIWRLAMQDIVGIAKKDPRCFSRELKDKLFKSSQTCAICKGRIEGSTRFSAFRRTDPASNGRTKVIPVQRLKAFVNALTSW